MSKGILIAEANPQNMRDYTGFMSTLMKESQPTSIVSWVLKREGEIKIYCLGPNGSVRRKLKTAEPNYGFKVL